MYLSARIKVKLDNLIEWITTDHQDSKELRSKWQRFIAETSQDLSAIKSIDFTKVAPNIIDLQGRKFSIDFLNDRKNYHKKKGSIKTEIISRALGAGRLGNKVLDLSAGLGIDAIFLMQMGYQVTAIERNPLVFLALDTAQQLLPLDVKENIKFEYDSAIAFLAKQKEHFSAIYFDPMFPEKKKSALSKQEMMFFRDLIGSDNDAATVIEKAILSKLARRVVVKRPLKAPFLYQRPNSTIEGKLIRFDIYGVVL